MKATWLAAGLALILGTSVQAQTARDAMRRLHQVPAVDGALDALTTGFPSQVSEWIRLTEIPAPSGHEQDRGRYIAAAFRAYGLTTTIDSIGNVTGIRRGTGGGPTVALAGHMDTVHPLGTPVTVQRRGDTLFAPGVFDNSASLANMLAVIRALDSSGVRTRGDLIFVATVQEELGMRGMDYWLRHNPRPDMLVGLDGGLGPIMYGALGIYWTRYNFHAAGAHTVYAVGKPHPARAAADAISAIYELRVPQGQGDAVFNVGQVHGGTVFNAIPQDLSFTMDLRSVNPGLLDSLDREIEARTRAAAARHGVSLTIDSVLRTGAGGTERMLADARRHRIVESAIAAHAELGFDLGDSPAIPTGSTDANQGVIRGIPSISIGRSRGGDQHTRTEWADVPSALTGAKILLLLATLLSGIG